MISETVKFWLSNYVPRCKEEPCKTNGQSIHISDNQPVDYNIWVWCMNECTRRQSKTWTIWSDAWLPSGLVCSRVSSMMLSISGA